MPLGPKLKKIFKSKYSDGVSENSSNGVDRDKWSDDIYYKPHELPRPKYRAVPAKEHKDKLDAFSFGDAWRKRSFQSTHSPGGTRVSSRSNSIWSLGRKSIGRRSVDYGKRKSVASESGRSESVASTDMPMEKKQRYGHGHTIGEHLEPTLTTQTEQEGDDDVANVGLSKYHSRDRPGVPTMQLNGGTNGLRKTNTAHDHQPFTEDDIAKAMQRQRLEVAAQS